MLNSLAKAMINLMKDINTIFYINILMSLETKFSADVETLLVNPKELKVNEEYFNSLEPELQKSALVHESLHLALLHPVRILDHPESDHPLFKLACEHAVNNILVDEGFSISSSWVCDRQYRGMSTEQIMEKLRTNHEPMSDMNEDFESSKSKSEEILMTQQVVAATHAAIRGHQEVPSAISKLVEDIGKPNIPWNKVLNTILQKQFEDGTDYHRPNRKVRDSEIVLPVDRINEKVEHINLYVDMSGSVTEKDKNRFITEAYSIIAKFKVECLISQFNTTIFHSSHVKNKKELLDYEFYSGGGTRIFPVLDHIKESKPKVSVIFTDGYFMLPETKDLKGLKIIWVIIGNPDWKLPKSKIIHYKGD